MQVKCGLNMLMGLVIHIILKVIGFLYIKIVRVIKISVPLKNILM